MLKEFKDFALKGNLIEVAVGLVLALAFAALIGSLVEDVLMPIVAAIFGQPDFAGLTIDVGDSSIFYGRFINAVITFVLVAFALFMFVVKPYNTLKARQASGEGDAPAPAEDITLLREIRDSLAK
ncbi:MAG: large conductance mechanosensitive channel protein MscL [Acidimicrobiia bacterium]|nr:large conductance mechanosensitive channel protein MscL [Acidimicrobiia bacterium]